MFLGSASRFQIESYLCKIIYNSQTKKLFMKNAFWPGIYFIQKALQATYANGILIL
jgi:hypothetical protein